MGANPASGHDQQEIFGTINHLLNCKSDLAGSRPQTPKSCQAFEAPPSPRRGFTFLARVVRTIVERDFRCSRSRSKSPRALGHLFSITHPRNLPLPRRRSRPPKGRSIKIIEKFRALSSTSRPAPTRREALTVWRGRAGTTNICRFRGESHRIAPPPIAGRVDEHRGSVARR
jgi:hypothetical protein